MIPSDNYGCLEFDNSDELIESLKRNGFCIVDSGYDEYEIQAFQNDFAKCLVEYRDEFGAEYLKSCDEFYSIRLPLRFKEYGFLKLATNNDLLNLISNIIPGRFLLNQQNGVINPSRDSYNQGKWHRDLPYQHFVSSRPLAINALYCVDDFTKENGATFVLPGSHLFEQFPSASYIERNAVQIEAKAGHFVVLDCMLYHSGGKNHTPYDRRGVNHVYTIPLLRPQIDIPASLGFDFESDVKTKTLLGYEDYSPLAVKDYIRDRSKKK